MGLERVTNNCLKELCRRETLICRRIWQKEAGESGAQHRDMVVVSRVASKRCKAAPVRCCLLMEIVPWKFQSLAGFELGERSSAPYRELNSRLSLPPYIWLRR